VVATIGDKMHFNRLTLITFGREGKSTHASSAIPLREHDYIVQFSFADSAHGWACTSSAGHSCAASHGGPSQTAAGDSSCGR
jgi:hypothetical protein